MSNMAPSWGDVLSCAVCVYNRNSLCSYLKLISELYFVIHFNYVPWLLLAILIFGVNSAVKYIV